MFRFRLQRVLELREKREQADAVVLAQAEQLAASARAERDELTSMHAGARVRLSAAQRTDATVGHLRHLDYVLSALDQRIEQASTAVTATETVAMEARRALEVAARDRRVLDRLKERRQEENHATEAQHDRVVMDEIALRGYARRRIDDGRTKKTAEGDAEG